MGQKKYSDRYVGRLRGQIRNLEERANNVWRYLRYFRKHVTQSDGRLHAAPVDAEYEIIGNEDDLSYPLTVGELREKCIKEIDDILGVVYKK